MWDYPALVAMLKRTQGEPEKYNWKSIFTTLGFVPSMLDGMEGRVEGIQISAVEDPLMGVIVTATYMDGREATQFDNIIPAEVSIVEVGKLFVHIIGQVHPDRLKKVLPEAPLLPKRHRPSQEEAVRRVPGLLRELFRVVDEFEFLFSLPFTPDAHMVKSIGAVVAASVYDLDLGECSEGHDGMAKDGRKVQVQLISGAKSVGIYGEPEHLIVLRLAPPAEFREVYNGPASSALAHAGRKQVNGLRRISLWRLLALQQRISPEYRLPQIRPLGAFMNEEVNADHADTTR